MLSGRGLGFEKKPNLSLRARRGFKLVKANERGIDSISEKNWLSEWDAAGKPVLVFFIPL
jgi:hypothetical protein